MTEYFDELETRSAARRTAALYNDLPAYLRDACSRCPGLAAHLEGHDLRPIDTPEDLATLPVLRKSQLMQAQQAAPPFGGFVPAAAEAGARAFVSPGPVWEIQVRGTDAWQTARALHAAGFRHGDRIHNTFSYHQTPGGFILDEGARALGCTVFPAGTGNTDAQLDALTHFGACGYTGTPDFLGTLLSRADERGITLPRLTRALVSGGALFPAMRDAWAARGIRVMQCYATADIGLIAYETTLGDTVLPGMVVNEGLIVEIVKPGSGEPVSAGEVGEIVVTPRSPDYPLVRFATGDLSRFIDEPSPCGRTAQRIAGWLGRADQRTKIRGLFVDPEQLHGLARQFPEISRWRLVVSRDGERDDMLLKVNASTSDSAALEARVQDELKRVTSLNGRVTVQTDALPGDGIVIEDARDYSQ